MSAPEYMRKNGVLSVREREKFRREIKERERALQGHIVVPHVNGAGMEGMSERRMGRWEQHMDRNVSEDPAMIRAHIRRMERVLHQGSPRDLSRRERQSLEKQAREDRDYLKRQMVPSKTYFQTSMIGPDGHRVPNPQFERATKAVFEKEVSNREFQQRSERYKNTMRELDPDNPEVSNIEKLRPVK